MSILDTVDGSPFTQAVLNGFTITGGAGTDVVGVRHGGKVFVRGGLYRDGVMLDLEGSVLWGDTAADLPDEIGVAAEETSLYPAGGELTLGGWGAVVNTPGPTALWALEMRVFFADGTERTYRAPFDRSLHGWQHVERTYTMPGNYRKVEVRLRFRSFAGQVRFDALRLTRETPPPPWPAARPPR